MLLQRALDPRGGAGLAGEFESFVLDFRLSKRLSVAGWQYWFTINGGSGSGSLLSVQIMWAAIMMMFREVVPNDGACRFVWCTQSIFFFRDSRPFVGERLETE